MKTQKILSVLLFVLLQFSLVLFAQDGKIIGKVYDGSNGSILTDAVLKTIPLNKGAASDLDGSFSLDKLTPGKYTVTASYIGYEKQSKKVELKAGEIYNIDFILNPESASIDTVTIEAERIITKSETGLLLKQQKADNIFDGISEQQIKRAPDASASDVLKRVIGVTIVRDKFIFVRGTSERYNNTTLNGVLLPSTESDKKAFSFDLFPSNLLDNIIISKTFTPDQPGNFSGGLVQITTKEFPDKFTFNYSLAGAYNTNSTGEDFYTNMGEEKKMAFINLGIDNGSRGLPSIIPDKPLKNNIFTRDQLKEFSQSFTNSWGEIKDQAPLNSGFQLSIGNVFNAGTIPIGVIAAYSYKNGFNQKQLLTNEYNTDYTQLSGYTGRSSDYDVLWGGLFNVNAKLNDFQKVGFKSTYSFNSDDETDYYKGFLTPEDKDVKKYVTHFTQRSLLSTQLFGEHYFPSASKLNLTWRGSYSETNRQEPDMKTMIYYRDRNTSDPFYAGVSYNAGNTYSGGRFFSNLKDINRSFGLDGEMAFSFKVPFTKGLKSNSKIKYGGILNGTRRDFRARNFGPAMYIGAPFTLIYQSIDSIFRPENFDVNKMFYDELTQPTDTYRATENNYSSYLMFDVPLNKLRIVIGARYEYNEQSVAAGYNADYSKVYNKKIDVLPSINLTYNVSEKINIRAAYSQTVSRPELREIAPFSFVDFVTGNLIFGNSTLLRCLVRNYDLRFEAFPQGGEIVSLSFFYKRFDNPIEDVFLPTSTNKLKTFQNATSGADNYGLEVEVRKNLGFINKVFKDVSINGNLSLVNSKVDISGLGSTETSQTRKMQGQSPYSINLGLFYDNYFTGTSVNVTYNMFGERISEVGLNGFESIREQGRNLMDLSISQRFFKLFELKFAVKDLFNEDAKYMQIINGEDKTVRNIKSGTSYALAISIKY
jgi:outer membrane receptor protein involved in Fe transport